MNDLLPYVAAEIAIDRWTDGNSVVILVPKEKDIASVKMLGCGNSYMPRDRLFVRASTVQSSLLSLRVSTLIVVGDCCPEGVKLAKEMLYCHTDATLIIIPDIKTIEGSDIWK